MWRRDFLINLLSGLAVSATGHAQQSPVAAASGRVVRIGLLTNEQLRTALLQGLREAGLEEGRNLLIEYRPNVPSQVLPQLAAELVALKVDVIVASGTQAVRAARQATQQIPIVTTGTSDPVGTGLAASLAHPGGNITGLSLFNPELSGKRLELLRETAGDITTVAVLWNPEDPPAALSLRETEAAGRTLGIAIHPVGVSRAEDFDGAFTAAMAAKPKGVVVLSSPVITTNALRIAAWTLQDRLPAISWESGFPAAGGLMSYGPDLEGLAKQAAIFVDKILKGAKPGDLPIEQPTKFQLVINLKTAKALGLTVPQSLLLRADEVIE
jgi:putative ABC transport system substrate-binding protein